MSIQKVEVKTVKRRFFCKVCQKMHTIELKNDLAANQDNFPFTYIYFHEPEETILTTLYIDKNLNIRGAESIPMSQLETNNNLFNPQKAKGMIKALASELFEVRKEFRTLNEQFNKLQEEHSDLKLDYYLMKDTK